MVKKIIAALLLSVVVVLFTLQNTAPCPLRVLNYTVELPLALMLVIAFGLGVILTLFLILPLSMKERKRHSRVKRELEEMKRKQLSDLSEMQAAADQKFPDYPET